MAPCLEIHPNEHGPASWLVNLVEYHDIDPWGPQELGCYSWAALVVLRFELATWGGRIVPNIRDGTDTLLPLLNADRVEFPDQESLTAFLLTWS